MTDIKMFISVFLIVLCVVSCNEESRNKIEVLKFYPLNSMDEIITRNNVETDNNISSDGDGSIKIMSSEKTVINLFETGDIDVENSEIIYRAKLKSKNLDGKAYLEMWCNFSGKGQYFSKGLNSTVKGTMDWTEIETPFFLKKGENPDNIKLNVVVDGKGIVWIDAVELVKNQLN